MPEQKIKLIIDSDIKNVYFISAIVETLCSLIQLSDNNAFEVKLCAVEAVNNSIIHAYGNQSGHEIEVIFIYYPDKIVLKVFDSGKSMPSGGLSEISDDLSFDSDDVENIKNSGRGLFIIKKSMDEVSYQTDNNKNCLTMIKNLKERKI